MSLLYSFIDIILIGGKSSQITEETKSNSIVEIQVDSNSFYVFSGSLFCKPCMNTAVAYYENYHNNFDSLIYLYFYGTKNELIILKQNIRLGYGHKNIKFKFIHMDNLDINNSIIRLETPKKKYEYKAKELFNKSPLVIYLDVTTNLVLNYFDR